MTKKKFSHIFDKVFWGLIALLPIIVYCIYLIKNGGVYVFADVFDNFGFNIDKTSIIYTTLTSIFGVVAGGSANIPAFLSDGVMVYMTYFVIIELIHLILDMLLYIPRIARKFLDKGVE